MQLTYLEVQDLRIIESASLVPAPGINLLIGDNAAGKSSLLEAIHLIGIGRSFRGRAVGPLIRTGAVRLTVHARLRHGDGEEVVVGVEKGPGKTRIRLAGSDVGSAASLARQVPVVLVPPDSQRLLTDGADLRRRLVDWGLFHVEPSYAGTHQAYRRALQQRNALLREASSTTLAPWDRELAQAGEQLHGLRSLHLDRILPEISAFLSELMDQVVSIHYHPGWENHEGLEHALGRNTGVDRARGHTTVGAHRADLHFEVAGTSAHQRLSRGEGKLFCLAVWLGQARHFQRHSGRRPLILIDDLAAELDPANRTRVMETLAGLGAQAFVTALSGRAFGEPETVQKAFHVERGKVSEMV
ncbi:MAG: DNA replication/repair protein RecF [Gammaproteobacteria bacterium]|nr:DNA replication/repair protein RecF [Gammaproteobacteria bacterium]